VIVSALMLALLQSVQTVSTDQQLIDAARAASAEFRDRNAAVRAGYRRLGPEIPEMGEHWINPVMVVEARYEASRPSMLTYATIDGRATLTGVGYALALRAGETPPPTGVSGSWHDHSATLTAELASGTHQPHAHGARVVVMHAWVWLTNPDGVFADANWSLPYVRSGWEIPARIDPLAARAVSLLSGGDAYYADLLERVTSRDFNVELAHARSQVAAGSDPRRTWEWLVERISAAMADETARASVRRLLGWPPGFTLRE
jgi:hypothetical protein